MSIAGGDSPKSSERAGQSPQASKTDRFLPSLGGQYSYSSFAKLRVGAVDVPWGARRRENSPGDQCCWGNFSQQDDRVIGQIGRILRAGAEAHHIAQRVCLPAMSDKSSRSKKGSSPRPSFLEINSLLASVGFDTSVDKTIQNDGHFRSSQELLENARDEGRVNMSVADCVKLEVEVLTGECTLQNGEDGQLERVVPIEVLCLQRDDGCIYARLGQWENHKERRQRGLELPGTKRSTNERPNHVIRRVMLAEVVEGLLPRVRIDEVTKESFAKESPSYGIRTRYQKAIHRARIKPPVRLSIADEQNPSFTNNVMYILSGGALEGKVDLYMWAPPKVYEARSKSVVGEKLTIYMHEFHQRLEAHLECIPAKERGARRVGAKDNLVRMFALLAWLKRGRPEQNQLQRNSDMETAQRYMDEQLAEGRNIEQLFQDFNQQFFVEAVEDVLAQPDMQAALKSILSIGQQE